MVWLCLRQRSVYIHELYREAAHSWRYGLQACRCVAEPFTMQHSSSWGAVTHCMLLARWHSWSPAACHGGHSRDHVQPVFLKAPDQPGNAMVPHFCSS